MSAAAKVSTSILVVLALGALLAMCGRVSDRGRFALSYSTYGAGPEGARAVFELTRASGFEARRWNEDVAELPQPATLVAFGGCDHLQPRPLSRPEREALGRWIEAGGTWIVAGATEVLEDDDFGVRLTVLDESRCTEDDGLYGMVLRADRRARERARAEREGTRDGGTRDGGGPDEDAGLATPAPEPLDDTPDAGPIDPTNDAGAEGVAIEYGTAVGNQWDKPEPVEDPVSALSRTLGMDSTVEREWAHADEGPLGGMPPAGMRHPGWIDVADDVPHEVLASIEGKAVAVVVPRGRGRLIVLASGSAFQNRDLVIAEGAPLFVRLLRLYARGPVLFDEYHLGAGEARSTMRYLFQRGAGALVFHLLVVLAIVLVRSGTRFGATRKDREVEAVTTASFVSAIGALFAKVRDPRGSFRILARRGYARIAAHHHLDEIDPGKLEAALRDRRRVIAADAVRDLAKLAEDGKTESLAHATRELDELVRRAVSDGA
ncbi:MAG: DUF4350 domain-containing protein [Deltaproteobacteria bacterium]|nr:DUF4350 domain-containing protein [Deltaproteobacteria bacterium]